MGPLQLSVDEKEYVNVPVWAGIGVILVGGLLCLWVKKASDRINQLLIAIGWHYVVIRN
ncbi:MAG: hypothetical protein ACXWT3_02660 [Methylococcaceae bacterium]